MRIWGSQGNGWFDRVNWLLLGDQDPKGPKLKSRVGKIEGPDGPDVQTGGPVLEGPQALKLEIDLSDKMESKLYEGKQCR